MSVSKSSKSHVSSKGQVVIPKAIRVSQGISAGSEVEFVAHPEGVLMRLPAQQKKYTLADLVGCLPYKGPRVSDEMIKQAVDDAMRERWERKEKNSR